MEWFVFSKYSIQGFTQVALALLIAVYLVTVKNKSRPTRILVAFFAVFSLALLANFALLSLNAPWAIYLGAMQAAAIFASMLLLMQFAYWFPENSHRREPLIALCAPSPD